MPTPTGLPKVGEVWRHTQTLPKTDGSGEWETISVDVIIIERSGGSYWSARLQYPDGRVRLVVDVSYWHSKGEFTFVRKLGGAVEARFG